MLFHSMEMELRQHFSKQRAVEMEDGFSEEVKQSIIEDVDVQFYMGRVTEELDGEEQAKLLRLIAEFYIVVRGFSFSRSLVESYKQLRRHYKNPMVFERDYRCLSIRKTNQSEVV